MTALLFETFIDSPFNLDMLVVFVEMRKLYDSVCGRRVEADYTKIPPPNQILSIQTRWPRNLFSLLLEEEEEEEEEEESCSKTAGLR
jgi:hypothetical protein